MNNLICRKERKMGLARFVAQDPYRPRATKEELEGLLDRVDGVLDWTIHDNGDVTLEYDSDRLYEGLLEDAWLALASSSTISWTSRMPARLRQKWPWATEMPGREPGAMET
jgi:hypothetical protein